jgi:hypothetical protein
MNQIANLLLRWFSFYFYFFKLLCWNIHLLRIPDSSQSLEYSHDENGFVSPKHESLFSPLHSPSGFSPFKDSSFNVIESFTGEKFSKTNLVDSNRFLINFVFYYCKHITNSVFFLDHINIYIFAYQVIGSQYLSPQSQREALYNVMNLIMGGFLFLFCFFLFVK